MSTQQSLQLSGKVIKVLPQTTRGEKVFQQFVFSYLNGNKQEEVCFETFGNKVPEVSKLRPGQEITVHFNLRSNDYNGKYFTNASAWKWETLKPLASSYPDDKEFNF